MRIRGIGLNVDGGYLDGRIARLEQALSEAAQIGYDCCEISGYGIGAVIDGRLHHQRALQVREVTRRFPLSYTVHGPCGLNLCLGEDRGVEERALAAYLEFCALIEAPIYVYHSGLFNLFDPYWGLTGLPSAELMEERRLREIDALNRLAERAAELGVVIAMENRDPHLFELAALAQCGASFDELTTYHAGLLIENVRAQIEAVGHPNLGMTLDTGHLYIASKVCGYDLLEAVECAAPVVRHIHMHDNVGKLCGHYAEQGERQPLGQGDLHMPPGWGSIPFVDILSRLPDYDGVIMLEIRPRYHDHREEALGNTAAILHELERGAEAED